MVKLQDIKQILVDYQARYRWLDIIAGSVYELVYPASCQFLKRRDREDLYRVSYDDYFLEIQFSEDRTLARFSLVDKVRSLPQQNPKSESNIFAAAVAGAFAGAAMTRNPAGAIIGLLVGGLLGSSSESPSNQSIEIEPDENRILTMAYDDNTNQWKIYHGPYLAWAKETLKL